MRQTLICLIFPLALAACGENGPQPIWAPDEAVQKAVYVSGKAPSVTL